MQENVAWVYHSKKENLRKVIKKNRRLSFRLIIVKLVGPRGRIVLPHGRNLRLIRKITIMISVANIAISPMYILSFCHADSGLSVYSSIT